MFYDLHFRYASGSRDGYGMMMSIDGAEGTAYRHIGTSVPDSRYRDNQQF